jgi:ribosomal protein S18 acetylase RimI-like enzyme
VRWVTAAEATERIGELLALEERASGPAGPQRAAIMARHFGYPGFRAVVAEDGDRLLGFSYGYVSAPGQWWNGEVRRAIGEQRALAVLDGALELAELHVDPPVQRRGLGRALLYAVTSGAAEANAVLTTEATNARARALYRSAGFTILHPALWNRAVAMIALLPLAWPAVAGVTAPDPLGGGASVRDR